MKKYFFLMMLFLLPAAPRLCAESENFDKGEFEIRTIDGEVYSPAIVEYVSPSGIDIGYLDVNGNYRMKGIPFSKLPPELQEKYGYDPEQARVFETKVRRYEQDAEPSLPIKPIPVPGADETATASETTATPAPAATHSPEPAAGTTNNTITSDNLPSLEQLEQISSRLQSALQGSEISLNPTELAYAFYAGRRAVAVSAVEQAKNGTVVRITRDDSGRQELSGLILVNGLKLSPGEEWVGFIYPTGLLANIVGSNAMPVFCGSAESAAALVGKFLELRSSYRNTAIAANSGSDSDTDGSSSTVAGIDEKGRYTGPAGSYGVNGVVYVNPGYYYYYWNWPRWEYPRPHRPVKPPRPPRPPQPQPQPQPKPPQPPKPQPQPSKPGGLQQFAGTAQQQQSTQSQVKKTVQQEKSASTSSNSKSVKPIRVSPPIQPIRVSPAAPAAPTTPAARPGGFQM